MSSKLHLREAKPADCRFVWDTNNHPSVRQQAIDTSDISWGDHQAWFDSVVTDPLRHLSILEFEDKPVGVVRVDVNDDRAVGEITIAVNPKHRGKGFGRRAIALASDQALEQFDIEAVEAMIRPGNDASARAFETAGYRRESVLTEQGVELMKYTYTTRDGDG